MSFPGSRPPDYPLSREEFRRALASGHGRAQIHVARCGVGEFRDEVLAAATVCGVYDLQCNGPRADWLVDLVLAAGVEREVIALPVPEDASDRKQRAALLEVLASRGVQGAREALYACWGPGPHSDYYAMEEILELDGDAGLLFVAREFGKRLAEDEEFSVDGDEFYPYDETRTEGAALQFLAAHISSDAPIARYLARVASTRERSRERGPRSERPRKLVEQVIADIRAAQAWEQVVGVGPWARSASSGDLQQVLEVLLELTELVPIQGALRCIGGATLPLLHPRIFELTRHADEDVRYWAARCLSKHSLHGVRVCGLEALARGELVAGLEMLARSTLAEDADAIVAALRPNPDPDEEHDVCGGLLDILKESPEVTDPRLALYAYERNPCMSCRESALCWLVEHSALPEWVREECAQDASADIRAINSTAGRASADGRQRGRD